LKKIWNRLKCFLFQRKGAKDRKDSLREDPTFELNSLPEFLDIYSPKLIFTLRFFAILGTFALKKGSSRIYERSA